MKRTDSFDLMRALQLETLVALAEVIALDPELEVGFQGGTCLHLSYHSPRFSEDLDFLAAGTLQRLDTIMPNVVQRVSARMQSLGHAPVSLSGRGGKPRTNGLPANPRTYSLVMPFARTDLPATRVKVEFMGVPSELLANYRRDLRTPILEGLVTHASVVAPMPVATLDAIEGDKVVALALRDRPKGRDVYDLGWIAQQRPKLHRSIDLVEASRRFYDAPDLGTVLARAQQRLAAFTPQGLHTELADFLPSGALSPAYAAVLIAEAGRTLQQFQDALLLLDESDDDTGQPAQRP